MSFKLALQVQHNETIDWMLVHVARDGKHLYQRELEAKFDGSRQIRTDHAGAAAAVTSAIRSKPHALFYVCGSGRFMRGMQELLAANGVSADRIRGESFK